MTMNPRMKQIQKSPLLLLALTTTLTACGSSGGSGGGTTPTNGPNAVNDSFSVAAGQLLTGNVITNDTDVTRVTLKPGQATVAGLSLTPSTGAFTYASPANGVSNISFAYRAYDANNNYKDATVSIKVNHAPTASNSCGSTAYNTRATIQLAGSDVDNDTLTYNITKQPSKGVLEEVTGSPGQFYYTPNAKDSNTAARGLDTFEFTVTDTAGETSPTYTAQVFVTPLRIMPLGDSITEGIGRDSDSSGNPELDTPLPPQRGGYRAPLEDLLQAANWNFDFVGSRSHGGSVMSDSHHEGHPGFTDAEISGVNDPVNSNSNGSFNPSVDGVMNWLNANPADVILLHAGTNNVGYRPGDAAYIAEIMQRVKDWQASNNNMPIKMIVAKIVDKQKDGPTGQQVETFNSDLVTKFNDKKAAIDASTGNTLELSLVDMFTKVPSTHLDAVDWTHLKASGYSLMAQGWKEAMDDAQVYTKCN